MGARQSQTAHDLRIDHGSEGFRQLHYLSGPPIHSVSELILAVNSAVISY